MESPVARAERRLVGVFEAVRLGVNTYAQGKVNGVGGLQSREGTKVG